MKKTTFQFPFALPVSIGLLDVEGKVSLRPDHPVVLMVINGSISAERYCRKQAYKENDILLIDGTSLAILSNTSEQTAHLLALTFNADYYRERYPYFSNLFLYDPDASEDADLTNTILNIALITATFGIDSYRTLQSLSDHLITLLVMKHQIFNHSAQDTKRKKQWHDNQLLVLDLLTYLNSTYDQKPTLGEFASTKHLSPNYTSHLIKETSGFSFQEILSLIRCRKSLDYLLDKAYRINELSYDMGFSSPNYFKENFRKSHGVYPAEYRQHYLQETVPPATFIYDMTRIEHDIKDFAYAYGYNLTLMSDTTYTHTVVDSNTNRIPYLNLMSDMGRISNIRTEMTETAHQVFDEMHKAFRMSIITIDVITSLKDSDNTTLLTIARNINYMTNLGFSVALETKDTSQEIMDLVTNFLIFYSRIFRDTTPYLKVLLRSNENPSSKEVRLRTLKKLIQDETGLSVDVITASEYVDEIDFFPSVYDSFILTPFAMDELFHPEKWPKEISFSLIDAVNYNGLILDGGNGLLTWNGIKKPWWYAYLLVAKLRGDIIDTGNDHIITDDHGHIAILTYNLCKKDASLLAGIQSKEQLNAAIKNAQQIRREHSFHFTGIYGTYKATHYRIGESTCLYSKWKALGFPSFITGDEEEILSTICHPDVQFSILEANGTLDITTIEDTFGISLVTLEKQ